MDQWIIVNSFGSEGSMDQWIIGSLLFFLTEGAMEQWIIGSLLIFLGQTERWINGSLDHSLILGREGATDRWIIGS